MRQSFVVILIFGIFLFVIGYFPVNFSNRLQPELFIDSDVLIVSKNFNFLNRVKKFKATPLADALIKLDYSLLSTVLDIEEINSSRIEQWYGEIDGIIEHPLMKEVFGSEFTIALFPGNNIHEPLQTKDFLNSSLVIARPHHHARIIELFSDLIDLNSSVTESRYGGYTIKRIPVNNGQTIAVTRVKDLLLMSFNRRILRKSLDVYDRKSSLLSEIKGYRSVTGQFKNCSSLTYVNVGKGITTAIESLQSSGVGNYQRSIQGLTKLKGYEHLIWGTWDTDKSISQKAVISFNMDEIQPEYRELFRVVPSHSGAYRWVKSDTIWYYWTNILRPKVLLNLYNHGLIGSGGGGYRDFFDEITETTGFDSEEILSLFQNDLLIALKNSSQDQFIPIPRILFALKINDTSRLEELMDKIIIRYNIPLTRQAVNGKDMYLWGGVIPTGDLQPAYSITDEYLIVSSNRQQIQEFILAGEGYQSLESSDEFQKVNNGLTGYNNSINYIDFSNLTVLVKEVISWIGTMVAIQDREAAQSTKIIIDQFITPLLDGLSMYSTVGMRSYTKKDRLIIESKVLKHYGTH